jgi:hypothetical protein
MAGPTPKTSVRVVPEACTAAARSRRARCMALERDDLAQHSGGKRRSDFLARAAGDQLAQRRLQPASNLGAPERHVPIGDYAR